jgi:GMP synthase (glutamine-hydrolysing)
MSKVLVLQHMSYEDLGIIGDVLERAAIAFEYVRVFEGQPVPKDLHGADALIVVGGEIGVYEQQAYPFLVDEMRLIEHALRAEKPVLGVCLGSELLASVLGAEVRKASHKEMGWFKVALSTAALSDPVLSGLPPSVLALHWHGDEFDLPPQAVALASSELTRYQAFSYGRSAYGFLFHMEATRGIIEGMARGSEAELAQEGISGRQILDWADEYLPGLQEVGKQVFAKWAALIQL